METREKLRLSQIFPPHHRRHTRLRLHETCNELHHLRGGGANETQTPILSSLSAVNPGARRDFTVVFFFFFFFFFLHARSTHRGGDKWRWIRQRSAINDGRRTVHGPERGGRRTSLAVAETRPVVCTPNTRAWRICIALYKQCF